MGSGLTKILEKSGYVRLAIDDGNPISPPDIVPMDEQAEGADVPHAYTDNPNKPGRCLICGNVSNNEIHQDDEGNPFGKDSDDATAPNNTGYQGVGGPPIQASASLVSLASGVNPFAKHKFKAKKGGSESGPTGAAAVCDVCGKGQDAAAHSNADGNPIGATGKMTGPEWSQTTHPNETAVEKIFRLTGQEMPEVKLAASVVVKDKPSSKAPGADSLPPEDFAGKHGSFPIGSAGAVSDALDSLGRAGDDNYPPATLKANILAIAKRKGYTLPASDK